MYTLQTLSLTFDLALQYEELPRFRGAMVDLVGLDQDLFHNHDNDPGVPGQFKNRYPLIQYRINKGHAAIFGLNAGARALEQLVESGKLKQFAMYGRPRPLEIIGILRDPGFQPQVLKKTTCSYTNSEYLAFSAKAYQEFKECPTEETENILLARLLRNHIVAFAKGVGWQLPSEPRVNVTVRGKKRCRRVLFKEQLMQPFEVDFCTNVKLPEGAGLGRKSAFGFGQTFPLD